MDICPPPPVGLISLPYKTRHSKHTFMQWETTGCPFLTICGLSWMTKHTWLCMSNLLIWTIFGLRGLDIYVCNAYVLVIWWCYVVLWWTLGLLLDIHKLWKVHPWWAGDSCVVSIVLCLIPFSPGQVLYTLVCVLYTYRSRLRVLLLWCIHMCRRTSLTTSITQ